MPPRTRIEPCEVLRRDSVPCLLWLEDAIANYNVPTCGFDVFLLVSDPDGAANTLSRAGWTDVETADARSCHFLIQSPTILHRCLKPPGLVESPKPAEGSLPPPPSRDPPPPTTTVLLSARDCNADIEPLSSGPLLMGNFIPPLPFLMDGLISGVLDAPAQSELESRLALQLVYLYAHCNDALYPELVDMLRFENRQFHIDALTGPSVGKPPLISWNRQVRCELRQRTRQLMGENSLLSANPVEYHVFIGYTRSVFRQLPHKLACSYDMEGTERGLPDASSQDR